MNISDYLDIISGLLTLIEEGQLLEAERQLAVAASQQRDFMVCAKRAKVDEIIRGIAKVDLIICRTEARGNRLQEYYAKASSPALDDYLAHLRKTRSALVAQKKMLV